MRYKIKNDDGEMVDRYGVSYLYNYCVPSMEVTSSPKIVEWLLSFRTECIRERDNCLRLQKLSQIEKNFEVAKIFSTESKRHLKYYRAVCFFIPYFVCDPPGDCKDIVDPSLFPLDLEEQLDYVDRQIRLL